MPFTLRPAHLAAHGGQVSLPGGAVEPGETTAAAALREFHEELGDDGQPIDLLGTLSPLYVQASNYLVTPWVGAAASRPQFAANATEVEEVLEVPLSHLFDPAHFGSHPREYEGHSLCGPALSLSIAPHLGRHVHDSWRVGDDVAGIRRFGDLTYMRAVVFDMDGLMFNTEDVYTAVGTEVLRRRGHVFTAELKDAMMGLPAQPAFEIMIRYCNLKDTWQDLSAESDRFFLGYLEDRLAPMPGLMELLDALERAASQGDRHQQPPRLVDPCLQPFDLESGFSSSSRPKTLCTASPTRRST